MNAPESGNAATKTALRVGQRVHNGRQQGRVTEVVSRRGRSPVYYVRWDAYDHDSGQYSASDLLVPARDLVRAMRSV